jgi:hypothetical protein
MFGDGTMNKITLDEALRAKLNGLNEELEICDPDGRTVGHFLPPELYREMLYAWAEGQSGITKEELDRRRGQRGRGRSLAAIWKDLGAK